MRKFKIPTLSPTTNKTIRFPDDLIDEIETYMQGTNSTFSAFVIAAVRAVIEELEQQEQDNRPTK